MKEKETASELMRVWSDSTEMEAKPPAVGVNKIPLETVSIGLFVGSKIS